MKKCSYILSYVYIFVHEARVITGSELTSTQVRHINSIQKLNLNKYIVFFLAERRRQAKQQEQQKKDTWDDD